jgi:uncharacterized RDD family membrane protein YckC
MKYLVFLKVGQGNRKLKACKIWEIVWNKVEKAKTTPAASPQGEWRGLVVPTALAVGTVELGIFKKRGYMPRKSKSFNSQQDLKVVLLFFFAFLLFLTAGGWFGIWFLLLGMVLAINTERNYVYLNDNEKHTFAGFWVRSGSLLVDLGFVSVLDCLVNLIVSGNLFDYSRSGYSSLGWLAIQFYMLQRWGQTPGKMVMGIKVLKADYTEIGWKEIILRNILEVVRTLGELLRIILFAYGIIDINLHVIGTSFVSQDFIQFTTDKFESLFRIWAFSEVLVLLTNHRRRALHDFLAGTVVVVEKRVPKHRLAWTAASVLLLTGFCWFAYTHMDFLYRDMAEKGDSSAQQVLASNYLTGRGGVPKDYVLALQWYQKAAAGGDPDAEYFLGFMYENGIGVDKNKDEAIRWYSITAHSGDGANARNAKKHLELLGVKSN